LWWFSLSIVPICLTIAILRYRLYEIDVIINRALVYGCLTAILAGLYSASISLFQKVFIALTGEQSDAAIVLTTLILASAFTPLRTRLQNAVDRRFKDVHDPARRLQALADEIRQGIWVFTLSRPPTDCCRLVTAFGAIGGALWGVRRTRSRNTRGMERQGEPSATQPPKTRLWTDCTGPMRDHSVYSVRPTLGKAAGARLAFNFLALRHHQTGRAAMPAASSTRRSAFRASG
jgi:hypothetical protein